VTPLRILVDPEIPGALEAFEGFGSVRPFDAAALARDPRGAASADVLVFRTATRIDAAFLEAAPELLALVTPVVGLDHIDAAAVHAHARQRGRELPVVNAPGSTAGGVADWVLAALFAAGAFHGFPDTVPTVGIVGLGHCGRALADRLDLLGIPWMACDPPRQAAGDPGDWVAFDALARCDAVSLHVPLTGPDESPWPTRGMIDPARLAAPAGGRTRHLVNAARGAVLSDATCRCPDDDGLRPALLLDVFVGEPSPDADLVRAARIATPHVAGSVFEGRRRALIAVRRQLATLLSLEAPPLPCPDPPPTVKWPRSPTRADLAAILEPTGIERTSRAFQQEYLAAAPADRAAVFRRRRAEAMRREIGWPLFPKSRPAV
jgi:erythronate-4-phosphate dehydrogenase